MNYIEVNGIIIDFDGKLAMVENNPMFIDEVSRSLQATAPYSPTNCKAFGYINRIDINNNKTRELPAKVIFRSIHLTGTVTVKYQGGEFPFYFKVNGDFWSAIKDKMLSEIQFDIHTFPEGFDSDDLAEYVVDMCRVDEKRNWTFPYLTTNQVDDNWAINVPQYYINSANGINYKTVPFLYLHYILSEIFEKNGLPISENAALKHSIINRLIFANNFCINEFEINDDNESETLQSIISFDNSEEPTLTFAKNHLLVSGDFIKIYIAAPGFTMPESNIYAVEKIDNTIIKLKKADSSENKETYSRTYLKASGTGIKNNNLLEVILPISHPDYDNWHWHFESDQYRNFNVVGSWIMIGISEWHYFIALPDPNFDTTDYTNIYLYESVLIETDNYSYAYVRKLNNALIIKYKSINPANHVPDVKINEFLKQIKLTFGIVPFVNGSNVAIKLFKDIISSNEFEDISNVSGEIIELVNPDKEGFKLVIKSDDNDQNYKDKSKLQEFDIYIIKEPVNSINDLKTTIGETNDIRLVIIENSWYKCNKSFLNSEIKWEFLTYNTLNFGNGEFNHEIQISTLLPYKLVYPSGGWSSEILPKLSYELANINFPAEKKPKLKVLYYHGNKIIGPGQNYSLATGDFILADIHYRYPEEWPSMPFLFRWEGENGIYNLFLKEYLEWETNVRKDCKAVIQWTERSINSPSFWKKRRIRGNNFIIKSFKYEMDFKTDELEHNETELLKC